jgi:chromosome segregation ATPase
MTHPDSTLVQQRKDDAILGYLNKRLLEVQNPNATLEEANKNVTIVERGRDTIKTEVDELTEKAANVLDELPRAQNETYAATREMQNLRQTFQTEHRIAKDAAKESSDKYNVVITEMDGLKSQLEELVSEKTSLGAENASLKEQVIAITAEKKKQTTENLSLTEQIGAPVAEKDRQATEFQKQLDTMKSENGSLSTDMQNLVAESGSVAAEKDGLITDKTKLEAEVNELQKAYKDVLYYFEVYKKRMKALAEQM